MKIYVVGLGPGDERELTPRAAEAIRRSDVIVGYDLYVELIRPLTEDKEIISTGMRREVERCRLAVEQALSGRTVAMVCSGDAGVYGMAGAVLQVAQDYPELEVEVVPGITAACSAAAVLGAPLTHDFAVVSLSDLLTPWELIEKRLRAAAEADFVLCLYNPASRKRADYLKRACGILLRCRGADTPCGIVRNIGRPGEEHSLMTLAELADYPADMFTTVIVGSSQTRVIGGRLVTPRGYGGLV
jgi:precorrin-3B C17-methyltransferase